MYHTTIMIISKGREEITSHCFLHHLASRFPSRQIGLELPDPLLCPGKKGVLLLRLGLRGRKATSVPLGVRGSCGLYRAQSLYKLREIFSSTWKTKWSHDHKNPPAGEKQIQQVQKLTPTAGGRPEVTSLLAHLTSSNSMATPPSAEASVS